ncbi:hypothetical protein [Pararhizobium haloflavum]|uniref:hypothetical protein n=1 Tax=Pararhizobium haloflavum TaxID=2037914 RepID=UPI000C17E622|nr:hypothetical protein [Pararhizobium haloflavum]
METNYEPQVYGSGSAASQRLAPQDRVALLNEWRDALVIIVADNPDAVETQKTIEAIDQQIAEISSKKI